MALIMALLALLLLTAVGLTLATSTSTEVQVAANYRWSLQALYNAEAGIEIAKANLVTYFSTSTDRSWKAVLGPRTSGTAPLIWDPAALSAPVVLPGAKVDLRDFEMGQCDRIGNGMGYGRIMRSTGNVLLSNQTGFGVQPLNGAFTVWIRPPLRQGIANTAPYTNPGPLVRDFSNNTVASGVDDSADTTLTGTDMAIVVSEGVAPAAVTSAFAAQARAVQVVEAAIYGPPQSPLCEADLNAQAGGGAGGAGVDPCSVARQKFSADSLGVAVKASDQGKTFTRASH